MSSTELIRSRSHQHPHLRLGSTQSVSIYHHSALWRRRQSSQLYRSLSTHTSSEPVCFAVPCLVHCQSPHFAVGCDCSLLGWMESGPHRERWMDLQAPNLCAVCGKNCCIVVDRDGHRRSLAFVICKRSSSTHEYTEECSTRHGHHFTRFDFRLQSTLLLCRC